VTDTTSRRGHPHPHTLGNRCSAQTGKGKPCSQPAMANGACWLHGGRAPAPTARSDRDGLVFELDTLRSLIRKQVETVQSEGGELDFRQVKSMLTMLDRLWKLVDTQRKHDVSRSKSLSVEKAADFLNALQRAVLDEIKDPAQVERIGRRLQEILKQHVGGQPAPAIEVTALPFDEGRMKSVIAQTREQLASGEHLAGL
jgi:hypothetical protein